jgi:hypothetical protein
MTKYNCSYAYDVSCYFDFTVEAETWEKAETKIEEALKNGVFAECLGEPDGSSANGERVFVSGEYDGEISADPTLEELEQEVKEEA